MCSYESAPDEAYLGRNLAVQVLAVMARHLGYNVGVKNWNVEWPILYVDPPTGQVSWYINVSNLVNVDPNTYYQSFSWGQAWLFYGSDTFYGGIGLNDYGIMLGTITTVTTIATGALLWSIPIVDAVVLILEVVTAAAWAVFGNEHTTTYGSQIPYVEIGVSEGNWWDFWNTGAYGELGAYSNQITPFNGGAPTYTGWLYFPFLTTVNPSDSLAFIQSLIPHSSVWPSLNPPW